MLSRGADLPGSLLKLPSTSRAYDTDDNTVKCITKHGDKSALFPSFEKGLSLNKVYSLIYEIQYQTRYHLLYYLFYVPI